MRCGGGLFIICDNANFKLYPVLLNCTNQQEANEGFYIIEREMWEYLHWEE